MNHVLPPSAQPETGVHPEDIDPLGKSQPSAPVARDEKHLMFILAVALIAGLVLIIITSAMSQSPFVNVFLGFSPLLITLIADMYLTANHFKPLTYWIALVAVHMVMMALLYLISLTLPTPINVPSAISVSAVFTAVVTAVLTILSGATTHERREEHHAASFAPERIHEYVQSIEDKVKAINFVIGRVYRSSNGGTVKMRERLRIPSEWYNEFHLLKDEELSEKLENAKVLVRKIRDRLAVYAMKENEVFSHQELGAIKHLVRRKDGEDTVITVLKTNDRDPVEHYYASAVEFCDRIIEELDRKTG